MIFIDLYANPPSQELINEGERLKKELLKLTTKEEKQKFINDNSEYWGKLKEHLSSLSNRKCWYSEAKDRASERHVDHFRPKNATLKLTKNCDIETINNDEAYWWLAFDWKNYRLSCSIPNTTKNAYFPLRPNTHIAKCQGDIDKEVPGLIDPTCRDDVVLITFCEDGKVYSATGEDDSWQAKRVQLSVRVYRLNSEYLVEARKEIQNNCREIIQRIIRIQSDVINNNNPIVTEELTGKYQQLREMVKPEKEFSAVAKNYILSRTEPFIRNIISF